VPHIRSKRKRHTIRAKRKRPIKPGETLYLYTGMRTKQCEKIIPPVVCAKVDDITIQQGPNMKFLPDDFRVFVEGQRLDKSECEALAYADGFDSFADMMKFWDGRVPFSGDIIHWKDTAEGGCATRLKAGAHA